ncbi:glycosyltransferase family 2 protein [Cruoricaptor ignavus]|uniref:glycosyltransferase family 2 protein n=1 Tax=Cruoricaptor ignavus TaxID=1118202 RepID=UPI00370DBBCC
MPKISVIVPCYNQAQYMDEALQSVQAQTFQDWECIIVNDGSPDDTEEVAKRWLEKDPRFKYLKKENGGLSSARNAGIEMAQGEWIQFLDCDDYMDSEKLQKSITDSETFDVIITNFHMVSDGNVAPPFCDITKYEVNTDNIIARWDLDFNIPIHCGLFNKSRISDIKFNEQLKAKEDWWFWIQLTSLPRFSYKLIDEKLVYYRYNANSLSKNFTLVYQNIFDVHSLIYTSGNQEVKDMLFNKLNFLLRKVNNENYNQKIYIRKLQSTKVLKAYLKIRKIFSK